MKAAVLLNTTDRKLIAEYLSIRGIAIKANNKRTRFCNAVIRYLKIERPDTIEGRTKVVRDFAAKLKREALPIVRPRYVPEFRPLKVRPEMVRAIERAEEVRVL